MPDSWRNSFVSVLLASLSTITGCADNSDMIDAATPPQEHESESHTAIADTADSSVAERTAPQEAIAPLPEDEFKQMIDTESETRKFAYVMFQYQRLIVCGSSSVQENVSLSEDDLAVLDDAISEATAAWDGIQKRSVPPELFFERFLPRAKEFDVLVSQTLTEDKQAALLPTIIEEHRGAMAFLLPGIPEALELTEEQLIKIEEMVDGTASQFDWSKMSLFDVPRLLRLAAKNRKDAESMLTESQFERWKQLQ